MPKTIYVYPCGPRRGALPFNFLNCLTFCNIMCVKDYNAIMVKRLNEENIHY